MNMLVTPEIVISETASGDLEISSFQSLVIRQQVFGLNSCELHVDESVIEGDEPDFMKKSSKLIGKKITVKISSPTENSSLLFIGIVTNVSCQNSAETHSILIKAESSEVLMNYGLKKKVFNDMTVKDIVQKVCSSYSSSYIDLNNTAFGLATSLQTTFVQYGETDLQFLQRIADATGNWCFNDGKKTHFGKLPDNNAIELNAGGTLNYYEVNTKAGTIQHESEVYAPTDDQNFSSKSQTVSDTDNLTSTIISESQKTFTDKSAYHAPSYLKTPDLLNKYLEIRTKQDVMEVNTVSGSSCETKLKVSEKIKIKREDTTIGEYRIVSVEVMITADGNYTNHFTGVAYSAFAPRKFFGIPTMPSEMRGRVLAVNDPDGHGKIKVKFDWQADDKYYGWLQVSSPSAGDDSGFYFRPEVDSWVIIALQSVYGLDDSYIAGALHHGNAQPKRWKHKDNHVKGIKTPEGNEILLEDKGNDGRAISIQTKDDDGNYFWITDKNGTTEIYLRSKAIKLMAENDLEISAGGKLILQGTDVKISSGSTSVSKDSASQSSAMALIELKSSGDVKVDSKSKVEVSAMMDVKISANANFSVSANMSAEISGSATATLKSSGVLTIQGTLVKIN